MLLATLLGPGPGCGAFYRYHHDSPRFSLHTDLAQDFLDETAPQVERMLEGLSRLFDLDPQRLSKPTIVFKGKAADLDVIDHSYSPTLLGYYIPFWSYIAVDTSTAWTRETSMLHQILLHEIAHHCIVTRYPEASRACWLNEGLAGNLEMTLFDAERFETVLLNPLLLTIARQAVLVDARRGDLQGLVGLSWRAFHNDPHKEIEYAISWSVVYFFLTERLADRGPLAARIAALVELSPDAIVAAEPAWRRFLTQFDLTSRLIALARTAQPDAGDWLTGRWAIQQLGSLRFLDDARAGECLVELQDSPRSTVSAHASLAFLRFLARGPAENVPTAVVDRGREQIQRILLDPQEPALLRAVLAGGTEGLPRTDRRWMPALIQLLDDPSSEVRTAAARALGTSLTKPTILNPSFWRDGEPTARRQEFHEWKAYWASYRESSSRP